MTDKNDIDVSEKRQDLVGYLCDIQMAASALASCKVEKYKADQAFEAAERRLANIKNTSILLLDQILPAEAPND